MEITRVPEIVSIDEILPLRHAVLRPNRPFETARFAEDKTPGAFHLAERDDSGTVLSCATFLPEPFEGEPAWRIRGMATASDRQGQGLGGLVLEAGLIELRRRGADLVWCNGRKAATPFYQRHGFAIHGEEFDIPPIGPHYVLIRRL